MESVNLNIYQNIINDMQEGVLTISNSGKINSINPACLKILELSEEVIGKSFAALFFDDGRNDAFSQSVLDAIYDNAVTHNNAVDYYCGEKIKKLMLTTSYLKNQNENSGVIVVINDVTELFELKDALVAMERIKALNKQLEMRNKLISETFGRYLSDEIVKKLLDTPGGLNLGGKKRSVTILMSDIRGFTKMSEKMTPAALISMLNNYLGAMTVIVQKYGGTIIEFIGDAIFAIFGAPIESDIAEENAVKCAVEMQNEMVRVNEYNDKHGYMYMEMGIGINTGDVILGNIGSEKRAKYGVVGENVNLCGRIESFTVGGQVLISQATKSKISKITTRAEMEVYPKGVSIPIKIYEVATVGDVVLNVIEQVFKKLDKPVSIDLIVMDGKFASNSAVKANILELSQREAILDINMPKSTNVKFISGGEEVFAKFIADNKIHLTMGKIKI